MSIARHSFFTLVAQVVLLGLQVVGGAMATRLLGRTGYGDLNLLLTTALFFATLFQCALMYSVMQLWSAPAAPASDGDGGATPSHGAIAAAALGLGALLGMGAMLAQVAFSFTLGARLFADLAAHDAAPEALLIMGAVAAPMMLLTAFLELLAKLADDIPGYNLGRLLPKMAQVGLLATFALPPVVAIYGSEILLQPRALAGALVGREFPLMAFLCISYAGMGLGVLLLWMRLRSRLGLGTARAAGGPEAGTSAEFQPALAGRLLRIGWRAYPAMLALFFLSRLDYYIVSERLDSAALGAYAVAHTLAELVTLIGFAINTAVLPHAAGRDAAVAYDVTARAMRHNLLYSAVAAAACFVVARYLVLVYAGAEYLDAVAALRLLLPAMVAFAVAGVFQALVARQGWYALNNLILGAGVLLDLAGSLAVVDRYGIAGVAAVKAGVFLAMLLVYAFWFHRRGLIRLSSYWRFDSIDVDVWRRFAARLLPAAAPFAAPAPGLAHGPPP